MYCTKIRTISVVATAAMLTGCFAGGGGAIIAAAPAITFIGVDSVTGSVPVIVTPTGPTTATVAFAGAPTLLGPTTFTATLDPATKYPTSATVSGGVNTSVSTLTQLTTGLLAGMFTGTAANGMGVVVGAYGSLVPATAASATLGLTYSNFGSWVMAPQNAGLQTYYMSLWAGGTQLTTTMPTTGSATYSGISVGSTLVNNAGTWTGYDLNGNLALTANFTPAGGTIAGNITGITARDAVMTPSGAFNDIALSGTIAGNTFSGTATAGAVPAGVNPAAITAGSTGTAAGHFYGPNANEVTGVWSMSTATSFAAGAFGAKK